MAQQVKNPPAMQETQVVDCKFMCQIQSRARQTKMLEFGAERGLLLGQGRRMVAFAKKTKQTSKKKKKTSELPDGFEGRVFVPFFFF